MELLTREAVSDGLDAILDRVAATLDSVDGTFPFVADPETGEWETTPDGNWCAGHWIGLLWLASHHANSDRARERFERAARNYIDRMTGANDLLGSMFAGMNYLYAGFRGYDLTGDRTLYGLGLTGADATVDLYHEGARQVPNGVYRIEGPEEQFEFSEEVRGRPPGDVIGVLDTIYTCLPVLWRAYEETSDPTFRDTAVSHADRHLDWYLKPDYRLWNLAQFDPETGHLVERFNHLAHSDETCWARGQGWNIAGLARAYAETGGARYREALQGSHQYYRQNTPDDLVPYWDFEDPAIPDAPRDTSAAAIAAYGLTRLPVDDPSVRGVRTTGEEILASILDSYLVYGDSERRGTVLHGCYNKPGEYATDNELIWTQYYVAYALHSLLQRSS